MTSANKRLQAARERAGRTPVEVQTATGIDVYDLEAYADELYSAVSLGDLAKLCRYFHISARRLFEEDPAASVDPCSFTALSEHVREHLRACSVSIEEFENRVGWSIADFLVDAKQAWKWNVDCLRDVCGAVGVNWIDALADVDQNDETWARFER